MSDAAPTVQYRLFIAKANEVVDGPDDAAVVVTVPIDEVRDPSFDPAVAYMRGRLKTTGLDRGVLRGAPFRGRRCCPQASRIAVLRSR